MYQMDIKFTKIFYAKASKIWDLGFENLPFTLVERNTQVLRQSILQKVNSSTLRLNWANK
jgi:hypothetical protein